MRATHRVMPVKLTCRKRGESLERGMGCAVTVEKKGAGGVFDVVCRSNLLRLFLFIGTFLALV